MDINMLTQAMVDCMYNMHMLINQPLPERQVGAL